MSDYNEMYKILFKAITECIELLQKAQLKTEDLYISSESEIKLIKFNKDDKA